MRNARDTEKSRVLFIHCARPTSGWKFILLDSLIVRNRGRNTVGYDDGNERTGAETAGRRGREYVFAGFGASVGDDAT